MDKLQTTFKCKCNYCGNEFEQKAFRLDVLKCVCKNNLKKSEQTILETKMIDIKKGVVRK